MIDPIAFKLGPLEIRWYALCIVTGLILAVYLAMREAPRKRINPDLVLDFILLAFPMAIIGHVFTMLFSNGHTIKTILLKSLLFGMVGLLYMVV